MVGCKCGTNALLPEEKGGLCDVEQGTSLLGALIESTQMPSHLLKQRLLEQI